MTIRVSPPAGAGSTACRRSSGSSTGGNGGALVGFRSRTGKQRSYDAFHAHTAEEHSAPD